MKLNKRYARNIRENLPFYLSASVLTMVALLMFYLFYIAGTGINQYGDEFFARNNVEDATFTTYLEIPDYEFGRTARKYNLTWEKEHYVNLEEDGFTARVFAPTDNIDLYEVIEGSDISRSDEIVISAGYAENRGVAVGDKIKLNGKQYTVAGMFLRPDYLYMLQNLTDDYKNVSTFFLAYMDAAEFERQFGTGSLNYKVVYHDNALSTDFREYINDNYYISSYLSADSNMRIGFVHEQGDIFILMSWIILVILPLITVALITILIGRKIKSEQKIIGTLSALGYSKGALTLHYSVFAIIPGLLGGILTAVTSYLIAQPFGEMGLADYEPMQATFTLPIGIAVAGVVIPTLIYFLFAVRKVRKLLKNDTVNLLNGTVGNTSHIHRIFSHRNMKVKYKMAFRSFIGNPGRTFVIFLGIFLGAFMISFAYLFIDAIKAVGDQAHDEFGTFQYEYILNTLEEGTPKKGEAMFVMPYENENGSRFSLIGADSDNTLYNLTTVEGKRADIANGWYISKLCAAIFKLKEGDSFTFRNVATLKEYTVKIDGIIDNGYQNYLVSSRENISDITGIDANQYNAILASESLSIDSDKITEIISDDTYQTQMENMLDSMGSIIYSLVGLGMIICICSLYATVNMMISESRSNISMLKVLGYNNRRINSMIVNSNHLLLIPGIAAGIGGAYLTMIWYCAEFVEVENMMIPTVLTLKNVILTIFFTVASYFISLFLTRRKVDKTDMIESLKDNRE